MGLISPLLSNLYLHILDRIWERHNLQQRLGARIVRYADDIVILWRRCRAGQAMEVLRSILERLGLVLNEGKTKTVNAFTGKFDFLGFSIWMGKGQKTGNYYPHVQPSKKSLQTIRDRVTLLTRRERTVMPFEWIVNEVNSTVRGWAGYFHYRNSSQPLVQVRRHVENRLISHLRKRHKLKGWKAGYAKFPRGSLYEKFGLYKVPTSAGWMKAHAL